VRLQKNQDNRPEIAALRSLVRLLARQAAAEQVAAGQQLSSSLTPTNDEDRGDG